jgi:flagellar assembly protein FliH
MGATKYTFDLEFRPEGDLISNAARARQKKSYTHDEIDQMCARARTEGMKAGQVRAQEAIASGTLDVINALRTALDGTRENIEGVRAEAAKIAVMTARKLARAALAAMPQVDVEAALRDAMHQAIGEPRILLRTTPSVAEALAARLSEIAHDEGYDGRVQISADPALKGTDCRIEWRGGGAERNEDAIEAAISELITRRFDAVTKNLTEE